MKVKLRIFGLALTVFGMAVALVFLSRGLSERSYTLYKSINVIRKKVSINNDESVITGLIKDDIEIKVCPDLDSLEYIYYEKTPDLWEENNKFGLYVYAESRDFFEIAQNMVNSNKGDWGYVLVPYNVKDRDYEKWNRVFQQLQSKRLIPIIQLWDVDPDKYPEQTRGAAEFLDSFIWPIRLRYISVYNEPNDSLFWNGEADPKEYARILDYTIKTFKDLNPDYFMLNGALNTSAPTDQRHIDAFDFMLQMEEESPGIFSRLDGWASHPYPQPNFSGSPYVSGRWSIKAYENELNFLKDYIGIEKELPVFITETGWAHAEGEIYNPNYLPLETVTEYLEHAFKEVWLPDNRVRAVILFTIWYEPPFDHFSYVNKDKVPYAHYEKLKELSKISGKPPELVVSSVEYTDCE